MEFPDYAATCAFLRAMKQQADSLPGDGTSITDCLAMVHECSPADMGEDMPLNDNAMTDANGNAHIKKLAETEHHKKAVALARENHESTMRLDPIMLPVVVHMFFMQGLRIRYLFATDAQINDPVIGPLTKTVDEAQVHLTQTPGTTDGAILLETLVGLVVNCALVNLDDYYHGSWETWWKAHHGLWTELSTSYSKACFFEIFLLTRLNCATCTLTPVVSHCSKCRHRGYCSKKCQKDDWPRHKLLCRQKS